jgi:uncharacterized protein (DUF1778 family)
MVENIQLRLDQYARVGEAQLIVRVRLDDKKDIIRAAELLGVSQAQFTRNILVQAARMIIAETKSREVA